MSVNGPQLARLAGEVADGIEQAHDGLDAAGLHELRVALARLAAALRLLERSGPARAVRGLRHDARWLRRRLGTARDRDVFADHPAVRNRCRDSAHFRAAVVHARLLARDKISRAVRSRRCLDLLLALRRLESTAGIGEAVSAKAAARYVARQLRRIHHESHHPDQLGPQRLHRLRGHVRGLRYACEFLAASMPEHTALIQPLAALQKTLGLLNDSFMVKRLAHAAMDESDAAALAAIAAHHSSEVRGLRRRLRRELKDLQRLRAA